MFLGVEGYEILYQTQMCLEAEKTLLTHAETTGEGEYRCGGILTSLVFLL
jgi:hypothetical protein